MANISKAAGNKRGITRTIVSTVKVNKQPLSKQLEVLLFGGAPPPALTMEQVVDAFVNVLQCDYDAVEICDQEVATERSQDKQKRAQRDGYVTRVRQRVLSLRGAVDADYGPAAVSGLGLAGELPESPDQLVTHTRNVLKQVADSLDTYEPILPDIAPADLTPRIEGITRDLALLEGVIEALGNDLRETQAAQDARNKANARWSKHYGPVASIVENLFRLAEMQAHADRVRPTNRRRAGLPEQIDVDNAPLTGDAEVEEDEELEV